jgi:hypothetical protein
MYPKAEFRPLVILGEQRQRAFNVRVRVILVGQIYPDLPPNASGSAPDDTAVSVFNDRSIQPGRSASSS